jgi:hypothetical protein
MTLPRRGNAPPYNAGPDQVVAVGAEVRLDGTRSFDPNGSAITYVGA